MRLYCEALVNSDKMVGGMKHRHVLYFPKGKRRKRVGSMGSTTTIDVSKLVVSLLLKSRRFTKVRKLVYVTPPASPVLTCANNVHGSHVHGGGKGYASSWLIEMEK